MKYFFDTEFIEDGKTIDLLSIGIVAEDGRELYLENNDADLTKASPWVREHVFPGMVWQRRVQRSHECIREDVYAFVLGGNRHPWGHTVPWPEDVPRPEFWAYYADYDWVVLCQLFGWMIDLPPGFPKYCRDFKQLIDQFPDFELDKGGQNHNALDDARWLKREYDRLQAKLR